MNTYRITYNDEEGARLQGAPYDPSDPSFEDVRADTYRTEGAVVAFYQHGPEGEDWIEVLRVGVAALDSVEQIDGEEGVPAQSVPAEPGVAVPPPAGEDDEHVHVALPMTPKKKWWQT